MKQKSRTQQALDLVLNKGLPVAVAARAAEVSSTAVKRALDNYENLVMTKQICLHCGGKIRNLTLKRAK